MNNTLFYSLLEDWYASHRRELPWRETCDPYLIWLSEIILQQTRVEQGLLYYYRFSTAFPTVSALARASEDDVLRLWQGLGYYTRARNLHKAAQQIASSHELHASIIEDDDYHFPRTYEELLALPGVGEYTAGAIASFAYDLPYPALDGNVYRVLSRLGDCAIPIDTTAGKQHFRRMAEALLDRDHPRLFNSAIMEFGALYCVPQHPDCSHCPLAGFCSAFAHGTVMNLPVHKPRPAVRDRYFVYTIYLNAHGETLIHQRQGKDIWHHLYEFPLQEYSDSASWDHAVSSIHGVLTGPISHTLSHQRLHACAKIERVPSLPMIEGTFAIPFDKLDEYALSRLSIRLLELLPKWQAN